MKMYQNRGKIHGKMYQNRGMGLGGGYFAD